MTFKLTIVGCGDAFGSGGRLQTGYLYHYALVMAAGALLLLTYFVTWPMISGWLGR